MGFFDRNRKKLEEMGVDPARLPPGQYFTERFPVLHVGDVPSYDMAEWDFRISGAVDAVCFGTIERAIRRRYGLVDAAAA